METLVSRDSLDLLLTVEPSQLLAVEGGLLVLTDVSGMPNRTEMCGTMWILSKMMDRLFPPR